MWVTAIIGTSTAFVEATLAQIHKEKDPLYGGYRGGPAYYIHSFFLRFSIITNNILYLVNNTKWYEIILPGSTPRL